jgi:hypothetical protein
MIPHVTSHNVICAECILSVYRLVTEEETSAGYECPIVVYNSKHEDPGHLGGSKEKNLSKPMQ